jgi:hypothetical protein
MRQTINPTRNGVIYHSFGKVVFITPNKKYQEEYSKIYWEKSMEKIEKIPVVSSNLVSVRYDPKHETLEIEFKSNQTWAYFGVPKETYTALMMTSSKGAFFHKHMKAQYACKKIG